MVGASRPSQAAKSRLDRDGRGIPERDSAPGPTPRCRSLDFEHRGSRDNKNVSNPVADLYPGMVGGAYQARLFEDRSGVSRRRRRDNRHRPPEHRSTRRGRKTDSRERFLLRARRVSVPPVDLGAVVVSVLSAADTRARNSAGGLCDGGAVTRRRERTVRITASPGKTGESRDPILR